MRLLSVALFLVLTAIAALHGWWGLGNAWPATSEIELVRMVVGDDALTATPPPAMTFVVAGLIFLTALVAWQLGSGRAGIYGFGLRIVGFGIALVFLTRGAFGFFFERLAWVPVEPFATLNVIFYSPLCLAIGAGYLLLVLRNHQTR